MLQIFAESMMIATGMNQFEKKFRAEPRQEDDAIRKSEHLGLLRSRNRTR